MKRYFNGFIMSLSMFSIIPTPQIWNENALSLMIPFFPLVGAIIGALWYGVFLLLQALNVPIMLSAVILALCPLILSGFIHIDGYMDTSDAIFSRATLEKKKDILKDSHVGAFAVIAFVTYA
ncbi:MAG: adenosylcobinamide-GDP ribazoletransferase, partial [Oscillospiraceae bacterium]